MSGSWWDIPWNGWTKGLGARPQCIRINHRISSQNWCSWSLKKFNVQMSAHDKRYGSEETSPTVWYYCQSWLGCMETHRWSSSWSSLTISVLYQLEEKLDIQLHIQLDILPKELHRGQSAHIFRDLYLHLITISQVHGPFSDYNYRLVSLLLCILFKCD